MARGEGGKDVFEGIEDREAWLVRLGQACEKHGWRVHTYVLMGNHFHLLLETPKPTLVVGMKWLMGVYSQGWNIRRKRRGHVFQGRYKAVVVNGEETGEYFRIVADYIHLNPVRSGWVGGTTGKKLKEWQWSSFPQYGKRKRPEWLVTERVLEAFDLDSGRRGHRSYTAYLEERAKDRKGVLSDESLKELRRGWCLGDASFRDRLLDAMSPTARKRRRKGSAAGPAARDHDEAEAEGFVRKAAEILEIDARRSSLSGRGRLLDEKAVLVWLVKAHTGVSNAWVSERLRTGHPSSVSKAVKRVVESPRLLRKARALAKQVVS
jgi:REP element-mobilizing transposase RayT